MRFIGRLLKLVVVIVAVIAVGFGALVATITLRGLPQVSGTLEVAGLNDEVEVIRDGAGIARIYASTPHDLFLAQGYVHAQDRLWQMEVWRHISAGRLSELFGKSQLDTDRFIRTLDWRGAAKRDLETLSRDARAALDAYAEGVNAYLDEHRGALTLPFVVSGVRNGTGGLGGYTAEPWTALDSAAWQKVQAWNLGGNLDTEIFRMLADERLGDPTKTDELFPAYPDGAPVITPGDALGATAAAPPAVGATSAVTGPSIRLDATDAAAWHRVAMLSGKALALAGLDTADELAADHGIGSNNWVVAPSLSATGGALLANDPHLGIGMPSVWYINGLHCRKVSEACPYDVIGVSFPGTPAVVLGHNARIAWGATNVNPDVQDLFVEELDAANPGHYVFKGTSRPFTVRREEIKVAGASSVTLEIRQTVHGPILNDVDPSLRDAPPLALRWTATAEPDRTFDAILGLNTAGSFDDFRAALSLYGAPSQNFVYADVDGHIGYQLPGRIPVRPKGDDGSRPVAGSDGKHEWQGDIPFDELPWQLDPASGLIVSANNAAVDGTYRHFLGKDWDPGDRAAQILEGLKAAAEGGVTTDEIGALQLDTEIRRAREIAPKLATARPATADGRAVLDAIESWDRNCDVNSRGCAAYLTAEVALVRAIFDDELGPLARDWVGGSDSWQTLIGVLDQPDAAWWDDVTTKDVRETAPQIVAGALDRAGSDLRSTLGTPDRWRWGGLHTATFREDTFGTSGIGPLEAYFNRGPFEAPGAAGAVLNTYYRISRAYPNPSDPAFQPVGLAHLFEVSNLPSYRLTIDMGELDGARIVQTTGQSGNPFDGHYGDLIDDWLAGRSLPLLFGRAAVEASGTSSLTLRPPG